MQYLLGKQKNTFKICIQKELLGTPKWVVKTRDKEYKGKLSCGDDDDEEQLCSFRTGVLLNRQELARTAERCKVFFCF